MSNREIMQQALEALELPEGLNNHEERVLGQACAALRAALAEDALQRLTDVQQEMEAALAEPRKHITDDTPCWCNPETTYVDPDTGASVIVHKEPQ